MYARALIDCLRVTAPGPVLDWLALAGVRVLSSVDSAPAVLTPGLREP